MSKKNGKRFNNRFFSFKNQNFILISVTFFIGCGIGLIGTNYLKTSLPKGGQKLLLGNMQSNEVGVRPGKILVFVKKFHLPNGVYMVIFGAIITIFFSFGKLDKKKVSDFKTDIKEIHTIEPSEPSSLTKEEAWRMFYEYISLQLLEVIACILACPDNRGEYSDHSIPGGYDDFFQVTRQYANVFAEHGAIFTPFQSVIQWSREFIYVSREFLREIYHIIYD